MSKKVLDVGQCNPDHSQISRLISTHFDAVVSRAHSFAQAISMAEEENFDLILINRILDADGSQGMEILQALKATATTSNTPVMLVSNYDDAQEQAIAEGALPGFGKSSLNTAETRAKLQSVLAN